jgi:S1-C subfamily serine protease
MTSDRCGTLREEAARSMAHVPDSRSAVGADLAQIERLARVLGGIPVWAVAPGSSARLAGVRFGDIILSVNGVPTPTFKDFLRAGRTHLMNLEFKVFRNGKVLVLCYDEPIDA